MRALPQGAPTTYPTLLYSKGQNCSLTQTYNTRGFSLRDGLSLVGSSILRADLPESASLFVALEAAGYSCIFDEATPEQPRVRQAHRADVTAVGAYECYFYNDASRRQQHNNNHNNDSFVFHCTLLSLLRY